MRLFAGTKPKNVKFLFRCFSRYHHFLDDSPVGGITVSSDDDLGTFLAEGFFYYLLPMVFALAAVYFYDKALKNRGSVALYEERLNDVFGRKGCYNETNNCYRITSVAGDDGVVLG